ncbi:hypothetical protein GCM10023079_56720 [Streptomyces chitinivorans]|uniref:SAM-dependent methyltransferase n=1 Tax=Streptomyces chitinivorans TaxID=1257027 RepID=UPI0031EDB9C6
MAVNPYQWRALAEQEQSEVNLARSKSSDRWLKEHFDDVWVKKSQEDGYRSRASYKLIELDAKDKQFRPGQLVVDLGAAPGGWSQVAMEKVGDSGVVIASDILPMDLIAGVDFVQGDFTKIRSSRRCWICSILFSRSA